MTTAEKTKLIAANEHDLADAVDWWNRMPDDKKFEILRVISIIWADPYMEAMSRLAQIGISEVALRAADGTGSPGVKP